MCEGKSKFQVLITHHREAAKSHVGGGEKSKKSIYIEKLLNNG